MSRGERLLPEHHQPLCLPESVVDGEDLPAGLHDRFQGHGDVPAAGRLPELEGGVGLLGQCDPDGGHHTGDKAVFQPANYLEHVGTGKMMRVFQQLQRMGFGDERSCFTVRLR